MLSRRARSYVRDTYPRPNTSRVDRKLVSRAILSGDRAHMERKPLRFYPALTSAIRGVNPIDHSVRASGDYVQLAAISAWLGSFAARRALDPIGVNDKGSEPFRSP